jgi:KaiC/GvpD/RAD55 family RecA-like ATPase
VSLRAYEFWELFNEGVVVIKGLPGAGKTLLAARAASRFKNAAWFTFYETADRLRKYLKAVNIEPPAHIFDLVSMKSEHVIQFIADRVLELKPEFVVVDGINALAERGERELIHAIFYHGISRERPVVLVKEGVKITPADYLADVIIEVEHKILETGAAMRYAKVLKARGRYVPYESLPYIISDRGPTVILPRPDAHELPSERLTTGFPELDRATGGGIPRGSIVAVVGPSHGLASKLMVVMASALARAGFKVFYHHHKSVMTFVKLAEAARIDWRAPKITWYYHPVIEHRGAAWWLNNAFKMSEEKYDAHVVDQSEQILSVAGIDVLCEIPDLYRSQLTYPTVLFFVFNSYDAWRGVVKRFGPLMDYVLIFRKDRVTVYVPDRSLPVEVELKYEVRARESASSLTAR